MAKQTDFSNSDKLKLRNLAGKVAELAARPIEDEKRDLWIRHNRLEATRPLIFCDPENGWGEILPESSLTCEDSLARAWELYLKREVFWAERMKDDRVINPYFPLNWVYTESDWGLPLKRIGGDDGGAYTWETPVKTYAELDRMHPPVIDVDRVETARRIALATGIFGDLLPVELRASFWWTLGLTWTMVDHRGMQNMMMDMFDQPENLHRLMKILSDGTMAKLDYLEGEGLFTLNNDGTYVGSGGFGWSTELPRRKIDDKVVCSDLWGFGESQETVGISPEMFAEFVLPYQLPILSRFGLVCYGCCEPINARWEYVKNIPHLRRVSVSPWADIPEMSAMLGADYIFSWKPHPGPLAQPVADLETSRKSIREGLRYTRDCRVEIIMKDNNTLGGNPENAVNWVKMVREEIGA